MHSEFPAAYSSFALELSSPATVLLFYVAAAFGIFLGRTYFLEVFSVHFRLAQTFASLCLFFAALFGFSFTFNYGNSCGKKNICINIECALCCVHEVAGVTDLWCFFANFAVSLHLFLPIFFALLSLSWARVQSVKNWIAKSQMVKLSHQTDTHTHTPAWPSSRNQNAFMPAGNWQMERESERERERVGHSFPMKLILRPHTRDCWLSALLQLSG